MVTKKEPRLRDSRTGHGRCCGVIPYARMRILPESILPWEIAISHDTKKIGATGFEPATSRPPAERATKLRHTPIVKIKRQTRRRSTHADHINTVSGKNQGRIHSCSLMM